MLRFCLGLLICAVYTSGQDPCVEGNFAELDHVSKRSPSFDMDSAPLCDRYLTEEWYRAKSHVMSTSPPILGKCGTLYPVWLRDPIPSDGETKTLTACEVGFSNTCERTYSIEVKNCTAFLVYKLKPLDVCSSAYCFELDDACVNESIYDIRVEFHNITWTEEEHAFINGLFRYDPSVNLICSFTPSDDDTLLYHIDWYVDNETVIQGQTVDKSSLDDAILSAADLNKAGKKINSWIHCVVGLKTSRTNLPCFSQSSLLFFAGIEILNPTLTLKRKGTSNLMLRPTIPFASQTLHFPGSNQEVSHLNIQLSFPGNTETRCTENTRGSVYKCSSTIESYTYNDRHKYDDKANWYKTHTIEVSNSDEEGYYMKSHKLVLRLETNSPSGQGALIYSDVVFHDVYINVVEEEEAWKGKRCSSYADPHQTTFDGYRYECQDTGCITGKTYIFYRNTEHLQEVQVRHENCFGRPRCVCAVAARSGQDVFTIDACYRRQYINFPLCNENALKVIKESDKTYKIIFPTGTSVKVSIYNYGSSSWYINLEVYPTVVDVNRTSGLCGVLDNDRTNDLRRRDGTQDNIHSYSYYNPPDGFSLSWQLPEGSTEDLLSMSQAVFKKLTPLSAYTHKLCTCDKEKTYCSYKQYSECKTNNRGREYHCVLHSSSRKKRDLEFFSRFQGNTDVINEDIGRIKRQALNEIDAYDICNDAFQESAYFDTCIQVVPNFSNETLVNCMNDLVMTGNNNLTQLHLDTALGQCQTYILLNSTLVNEHPDVTTVIVNLCPNNCSNRGICSSGNCTCEFGFGGSDCSFDVLSPPTITRLSDDGVCDKSSESCNDITLYGHYFLENMGTTCYVIRKEMDEKYTVSSQTSYTVELQERTLYEGFCSLEYGPESSFYTTFHFNLSNDGTNISTQYAVYVYQSACQTFQNISGNIKVTLQSGYCYINGTCIQSGTLKSNDSCWRCSAQSNAYDWTWELDEACVNESIHDIRVEFHNITWTEEEHAFINGLFRYDPSVNLICSFTPSDDDTLLYHIDWYVDNETVIQGQTVDKLSLNDAILSAADLNKAGKKINSWIHCVVGLKTSRTNLPFFSQSSLLFFAGIEILNPTLTQKRKGTSNLMLRPTIPFASQTLHLPDGNQEVTHLDIQLSFPGNTEARCTEKTRGSVYKCSSTIESYTYNDRHKYDDKANWYKTHTIEVSNSDEEGYYMKSHKLMLRLETNSPSGQGALIYSDVVFHDVYINVVEEEEAWKGKRCSSYADPHQTTFDGYRYECQDTGCITGKTYIFYRNTEHLQEVQVRHENCFGRPRCVCAVAARSGQDVFTIDACYRRQYIHFPLCNENALKVIKESDKTYKIIFPTGTSVKVSIYNYGSSSWYINLEVYPTVVDVNRTSGLCGVLDNDRTNDLRRRDGTQDNIHSYSYYNPPDGFSLSWQLPEGSTEDLLSMSQDVFKNLIPLSAYTHKLCTCDKEKTYCSYKQYSECKTNNRGREYHCVLHSSSRKKRDLEFFSRFQGNTDVINEDIGRIKRQALNEVDAYDICNDAFQESAYFDTCIQVVPNFSNETLVNCMNDLVMTGNNNLTQLHLDTALGQCQTYILLNSTLVNEHPDVTTVIVNLCPNNCSNRGICSSGNCTCEFGFGGSDCSFDVLSPPTITRLSDDGVCDKSSESCNDITLYGHYFLENMGTTCYVIRKEMDEKYTVSSQTSYTVELQERTLYEGFCSLEYGPESSFYTTFHFNMSNDGTQFSPQYTVYVYQSACQTFQNISGNIKVTLQSGYCYINGTCIQSGTLKSNNSCWQCSAQSNAYDWTWDCTNTETTFMPTTFPASASTTPLSSTAPSSTIGPLSTISRTSFTLTSTPSSIATSQSTISSSATLSQTTGSPPSIGPSISTTSDVKNTSSTTQSINSISSTTITTEFQKSASTTKQPETPSSNGVFTSTASSTTLSLPTTMSTVKVTSSGTTTTLGITDDEQTNKQTTQKEGMSAVAMGLIVAVVVVATVIFAIAGYMLKQKIFRKKDTEHSTLDTSMEDDVNIYPDNNRTMANRGNFNPTDLLQFDSPADKFSRPPSATSTRMLPPHQDFRKIYDQSHLNQLFGAK